MHGVLNLLKPPGMTSHDAVAFVRRVAGLKRVGHTGTLDPAAAGVLPVCLGQATRLVEYLQNGNKEYVAELTFGAETDTLDAVGTVVREAPANHITLESLRVALDQFRGTITQTPPLYSAIKQDGKKLYELARAGVDVEDVEIKTRQVQIDGLFVTRFVAGERPRAMLRIECGGGTYIRSLVRDIGNALDSAATMTFLVRTRSGCFSISAAATVEQIAADWQASLVLLPQVLRWCARTIVTDDAVVEALAQGRRVQVPVPPGLEIAEYKADYTEYKYRLFQIAQNKVNPRRVLFLNAAETLAALGSPVTESGENWYKAEKVFMMREDD